MKKKFKPKYFTVIIDVYYNLKLFQKSINSILNQSYKKIEIVIIDNGSDHIISNFITVLKNKHVNIKVIRYKNNIYSHDDPEKRFQICYNEALKISFCEYIYYQSYDDLINKNYLTKMAKLLLNPNCITASGLLIKINEKGSIIQDAYIGRFKNIRSKFIHGGTITLDNYLNKHSYSYASNISHFAFKRKALEKVGGFHRAIEQLIFLFILPQGITGYDESAYFYYREHRNQGHKITLNEGYIASQDIMSLLKSKKKLFNEIWDNYPKSILKTIIGRKTLYQCIVNHILKYTASRIVECIYTFNFKSFYLIVIRNYNLNFYKYIPYYLFIRPIYIYYTLRDKFKIVKKYDPLFKKFFYNKKND